MTIKLLGAMLLAGVAFSTLGAAVAAPVLKSEVVVTGEIVTVGDMFEQAGALAQEPLEAAEPHY